MGKRGAGTAAPRLYWKDVLMKLKAPEFVTSINVGGQEFSVDKSGMITVPDNFTEAGQAALRAHGFEEPGVIEPKAKRKADEAA